MRKTFFLIIPICYAIFFAACSSPLPQQYNVVLDTVAIYPDYTDLVIPYNIAPLNFKMNDDDLKHIVVNYKSAEYSFTLRGKNKINIPIKKWRKLLGKNIDGKVAVEVYAKKAKEKEWILYPTFYYEVSADAVDKYLAYRLIDPGFDIWVMMGLYQRNVENFEERALITNAFTKRNCINCHTFNQNSPDEMVFHMRQDYGATYVFTQGKYDKLDTKTDYTLSNCVYPYWHPSGRYIAFSTNKTQQALHSRPDLMIEVYDQKSDVVVLDVEKKELFTTPLVHSGQTMDTYPVFSADGKRLFFCRTHETDSVHIPYKEIRYNLCAIDFDATTSSFGSTVDTLIYAQETGKSITFAHPSFDGKYILLAMSDYGCFPSWNSESDLYLYDLSTSELKSLDELNSEYAEGYNTWSSNSKWIVFSSRRSDQLYNRPYFSHIDERGNCSKPFILPQKDPLFYTSFLKAYNKPELVKSKIPTNPRKILKAAKQEQMEVVFRPDGFSFEKQQEQKGTPVN